MGKHTLKIIARFLNNVRLFFNIMHEMFKCGKPRITLAEFIGHMGQGIQEWTK